MTKCYVFDLDGTLANLDHRLHLIQGPGPKDWRAFFAAVPGDTLIEPVAQLLLDLWPMSPTYDRHIVIVSGRSDECEPATRRWLSDKLIPYHKLYMRAAGDHRPDDLVKREILDRLVADGYRPIMIFDDRQRVVDMWRREGYTCAQVASWEETP